MLPRALKRFAPCGYRFLRRTRVVLRRFAVGGPFSSKKTDGKRAFFRRLRDQAGCGWARGAISGVPSGPRRMRHSPRRRLPRAKPRQAPAPGLGRLMGRVEPPAGLDPRRAPVPRCEQEAQRRARAGSLPPLSVPRFRPQDVSRRTGRSAPAVSGRSGLSHEAARCPAAQGLPPWTTELSSGARGVDEIRRPGSISWRTPLMCRPVGMPAGPDPQDRAFRAPRQPTAPAPAAPGPQTSWRAPPASRNPPRKRHGGPFMAIRRPGESGQVHGARLICSPFVLKTAH